MKRQVLGLKRMRQQEEDSRGWWRFTCAWQSNRGATALDDNFNAALTPGGFGVKQPQSILSRGYPMLNAAPAHLTLHWCTSTAARFSQSPPFGVSVEGRRGRGADHTEWLNARRATSRQLHEPVGRTASSSFSAMRFTTPASGVDLPLDPQGSLHPR